jgi:hypothetical protein
VASRDTSACPGGHPCPEGWSMLARIHVAVIRH